MGAVNYLRSEVRSSPIGRLPFSEQKRREIAAMTCVLKGLSATHKSVVLELTVLLDPSNSLGAFKPGAEFIKAICAAAGAVVALYDEQFRQGREARR